MWNIVRRSPNGLSLSHSILRPKRKSWDKSVINGRAQPPNRFGLVELSTESSHLAGGRSILKPSGFLSVSRPRRLRGPARRVSLLRNGSDPIYRTETAIRIQVGIPNGVVRVDRGRIEEGRSQLFSAKIRRCAFTDGVCREHRAVGCFSSTTTRRRPRGPIQELENPRRSANPAASVRNKPHLPQVRFGSSYPIHTYDSCRRSPESIAIGS